MSAARHARQLPDLVFRELGFVERAAHAVFARGLSPRAIVAAVVGVAAVGQCREAARFVPASADARTAHACRSSSGWPDWRGIPAVRSRCVRMIS